ncbi:hypothetical protein AAFJ72_18120 [Brevibacillus gelatini]|uniref:hypothetical protein n=1 Tax=Brevibacillus gelatini TaxID=1655277 RepID=UPI003D817E6C
MGMKSREYSKNLTVTLAELKKIKKAQRAMYKNGLVKLEGNTLESILGTVSTILGLVFVTSTPTGIVAAITSLVASLGVSAKDALKDMVYTGYFSMDELIEFLEENPKYSKIQVEFPFIEYYVDGRTIRFVSGEGLVKKVYKENQGWFPVE